MKIVKKMLIILFCFYTITASGQNEEKKDSILLTEICIDNICFGDSISKIINHFGTPDTVRHIIEDWEFSEPENNEYIYGPLKFYEILYPNLTNGLFYGCIIDGNNVVVSIKNINLLIGETTLSTILFNFKTSIELSAGSSNGNHNVVLYTKLPSYLKNVEGAFISGIYMLFTNNILKRVFTKFDLN